MSDSLLSFYRKNREQTSIFPQSKLIYPFGLYAKKGKIFLSTGVSFGNKKFFLNDSIAPFDFDKVEYLESSDIIILRNFEFNFSIRIYDVSYDTISEEFWDSLDRGASLKRGRKICKSGKASPEDSCFLSSVEVYTDSADSILFSLVPETDRDLSEEFLDNFYMINCLNPQATLQSISELKEKESIQWMNSFQCYKQDSLENKNLFFFSYSAVFV